MTETLRDKRVEQAADDAVRFDKSIEARSAKMECGFYVGDFVKIYPLFFLKKSRAYTYDNVRGNEVQKRRFRQR